MVLPSCQAWPPMKKSPWSCRKIWRRNNLRGWLPFAVPGCPMPAHEALQTWSTGDSHQKRRAPAFRFHERSCSTHRSAACWNGPPDNLRRQFQGFEIYWPWKTPNLLRWGPYPICGSDAESDALKPSRLKAGRFHGHLISARTQEFLEHPSNWQMGFHYFLFQRL